MFKITIDNQEVITDKDFTIEEEILNTPSVILNNVYPKEWEQDKDYVSRFYHPNEYSKCKIFDEEIIPEVIGEYAEGISINLTYDNTKDFELLDLKGQTSQSGTPTPSSPVPVNTGTGRQLVEISNGETTNNYEINLGKNLFDLSTITYTNNGRVNITIDNNSITQKNTSTYARGTYYLKNLEIGTTYTLNMDYINENSCSIRIDIYNSTDTTQIVSGTATTNTSGNLSTTFTATETTQCLRIYSNTTGTSNSYSVVYTNIQLEKGSQKTSYSPYKIPIELCQIGDYQDIIFKNVPESDYYDSALEQDAWYIHKEIGKVVLNGTENGWASAGNNTYAYSGITDYLYVNQIIAKCDYYNPIQNGTYGSITNNSMRFRYHTDNTKALYIRNNDLTSLANFKTWLGSNNVSVYYILATPTTELIEDNEVLEQLGEIELLNGENNILVSSPYIPVPIKMYYNYKNEEIIEDLYFCGVVKNSGDISLNPREPHFQTLQILSYKTFLSEGETLDFVIYQKTIREAIEQVISVIADYGFVVGNIDLLNPDEIIGAYSTKDKSAYDVFQYIADITQSRWTTRTIDEDTVAIDFYDPSLMEQGTPINYTKEYFEENLIDDMSYSYGTNDYRNKQVMTSEQVYSNITQTQNIVANGYQTQFNTEQPLGKILSIKINNVDYTFATDQEKELGVVADFYYTVGNNYFESANLISVGTVIQITYIAIVEGRQIIINSDEIEKVSNSTGVKGVVARYENRNDAITSDELQLIGQSYIKYKGVPEIILKIQTRKNLWEIGQKVRFYAPIDELDTEYMVKAKKISRIMSIDTIFYTFELTSSFNDETAINYFDNQRAKSTGNIGEGEYISRNIDITSNANVIFYDTQINELQVVGDNILNAILEAPFVE